MNQSEERQFTVLMEQVRSEVKLVAEGLAMLDQKVDRGFRDLRQDMAVGLADVRTAITQLDNRFKAQTHDR